MLRLFPHFSFPLALILGVCAPLAFGDADLLVAKGIGGTAIDIGNDVAVDASGNVFVAGNFRGTADFDPSGATVALTSGGEDDAFVAKYTSAGALLWAKHFSGYDIDRADGLGLDGAGNVYVAGNFWDVADFDPTAGVDERTAAGLDDIFVVKLDSDGNVLWVRTAGGAEYESLFALYVDSAGNVYGTGRYTGTTDLDPSGATASITAAGASFVSDTFIFKWNSSGDFVWAKSVGGVSDDEGYGIHADSSENVYITGFFQSTADFDPGASALNLTAVAGHDVFALKLDASGALVWAGAFGGSSVDDGQTIYATDDGRVFVAGDFRTTVDFDPGAGVFNLASFGASDAFLVELGSGGAFVAAQHFGGTGSDGARAVLSDTNDAIHIAGEYQGAADFDPGAAVVTRAAAGASDLFLAILRPDRTFAQVQSMGGTSSDTARDLASGPAGAIYLTGFFNGTADFDPGAGTLNLISAGNSDIFLAGLGGDTTGPVITLTGGDVNVECGVAWGDPGYSALDTRDGTVTVQIGGDTVNTAEGQLGQVFVITYNAQDAAGNAATQQTRTVTVVDNTAPVLNLVGGDMNVECGAAFVDPGATANDSCEGALAVSVGGGTVDTSPGNVGQSFVITYNVQDSEGNAATQQTRTVTVVDNTAPVVTLVGGDMNVSCNAIFEDPGAAAEDACAGSLPVIVGGDPVDVSTPGVYVITYTADDGAQQAPVQSRNVTVLANCFESGAGGRIQVSLNEGFIVEGQDIELRVPSGFDNYAWLHDGVALNDDAPRITGTSTAVLTFAPVMQSDSGVYVCVYDDGAKSLVGTEPYELHVLLPEDLPAAGAIALVLLGMGLAWAGMRRARG
ncbi:MAG: DUF5011 domain-containing protein [Candidatus Hydrogenedentes bacterium]|nr:DUF5011 domain-containing protein [Candidatus Hydrogenedentota bacterium]